MNLSVSSTSKELRKRTTEFILSPKRFVFFGICVLVFTIFAIQKLNQTSVYAAPGINQRINFQGKVVNSNGTNISDGNYDMVFRLYTQESGGSPAWTETWDSSNQVSVNDGIFRVDLGKIQSLASIDFNTDEYWLSVEFNGDGEMDPRIRFAAVPYAFNAKTVSGLTVTNTTGTFTLANAKTFTVNNSLGLSGTDGTTFTFPSSSDTVVTLTATQELTNKTIGSTGLTFSGATTDVTTVSNEDFSIAPNGTGNINLTGDFNSQVLIGASGATTEFPLLVRNGIGNNAALAIDNLNSGDIFTASSAGTTKFTISSTGTLTSAGYTNNGGILYTTTSGLISQTAGGSETNCLTFTGGAPAWGSCGSGGSSNWVLSSADGTLSPINNTLDLLIGGTSTQSAAFSVLGIAEGSAPSASVSATTGANATKGIYLSGDGSIQTTRNNTLTLGGTTTGNISMPLLNTKTFNITSDLTNGARSSAVLSISQANNAGNNSSGNLLLLTNSDTGSTAPLLSLETSASSGGNGLLISAGTSTGRGIDISQAATGIYFSGQTTYAINLNSVTGASNGILLNGGDLTTGGGILLYRTSGLTTGVGITLGDVGTSGSLTSFTGDQLRITPSRTHTGATAINDTGNFLDLNRSNTINNSSGTFNISGDLATLSSNCIQTSGVCRDTSNLLRLTQSYGLATGAVLNIENYGVGSAAAILSNSGGQAALILNKTGNAGDIFTASSSGTVKFTLDLNGSIKLAGGQTFDTLTNGTLGIGTVNATTLTVGRTGQGITLPGFDCSSGYDNGGKLTTTAGGVLTCGNDAGGGGSGSSNWVLSSVNGTLSPINNTLDLLLGGTASSSAKFAVLNIAGSLTPVASISAQNAFGNALSLSANGTIQTSNLGDLTLGGIQTGGITLTTQLDPLGDGIAYGQIKFNPTPSYSDYISTSLTAGPVLAKSQYTFGGYAIDDAYGKIVGMNFQPILRGIDSGASLMFGSVINPLISVPNGEVTGVVVGQNIGFMEQLGTGTVGEAYSLVLEDPASTLNVAPENAFSLVVYGKSIFDSTVFLDAVASSSSTLSFTGSTDPKVDILNGESLGIRTSAGGNAGVIERLTLLNNGTLGLGTIAPVSQLDVTRPLNFGVTGKALAIFDQIENQDILSASAGGATKFVIRNGGSIELAANQTFDTLTNGTLGIGTVNATTLTVGRTGQGITLPGFDCSSLSNGGKLTTTSGGVLTCDNDASGGGSGSSNWTLSTLNGTLSPNNNTVDFLWGSISSSSARFKITGNTLAGTSPVASISANTTFAGFIIDQNGTGDFLTASASGLTKFTVTKEGGINASAGITVNAVGSIDIYKSTSGDNLTNTDFQRTANGTSATLTNLNNTRDSLELSPGTVPNSGTGTITTSGQPAVPAALGQGAMSILRQNGTYLLIRGGNTTTMYIYDTKSGQIYASPQTLNAAAEEGAIALPRSDGRYRIVHGNAVTTTSLVDPNGVVAVGSSIAIGTAPTVNSTVAYRRQNGRYFIAIGGTTASSIYNPSPTTETFSAGPSLTTTGLGAQILPRPDGSALIINGGSTATTQLYNPNNGTITNGSPIGSVTSGPALPTNCEINGAGSVAIQLPNWRYVILSKANVSVVYDAAANTMGPCQAVGPATALGQGAHAIRYQSRKILIMVGGNSTDSYIYDPTANTYTAHGTSLTAIGIGAHTVMNYDGTFQVFVGNAVTTNKIDVGLNMSGSYVSEDFNTASLNPSSTLLWTIGAENIFIGTSSATTDIPQSNVEFFVKTAASQGGLSSAIDKPIQRSGDLVAASSSDSWARVTVRFRRPIPQNPIDERFVYFSNGPLYLKDYASPTLFDYTLDNSSVLTRNADNFANAALNNAPYESSASALTRVQNLPDRLTLPIGQVPGDALVSTTGFYQGLIGPHPTTLVDTGEGTIVMQLPDGQVGIIATASASVNYYLYDHASSTFSPQSGAGDVPTTYPGWGSYAIKLPDGRFFIVFGENAAGTGRTTTNIYDPRAASGSRFIDGPALSANAGRGGFPIKNTDGTYTLVHGGAAATTTLFNPYKDLQQGTTALAAGPTTSSNVTCGAWAIPMAGNSVGMYRVFIGVGQFTTGVQTTMTYDATKKQFQAAANSGVVFGCGSYAFQRQDGAWMVVAAAAGTNGAPAATMTVYNPYTNTFAAGTAMTNAAGRGSVAIPRADGTWLITRGQTQTINMAANTANASSIWSPYGGSAVLGYPGGVAVGAGPQLVSPQGAGSLAFQRADGKWVMLNGGMAGSNNVSLVDTGYFADGQYLSGQMYVPQLTPGSVMTWKQTADKYLNIEVRTAANKDAMLTADYKPLYPSDGNIGAAATDKWLQVQINFSRDFPTYGDVHQDVWNSRGAFAWRILAQPTLFEYKITNDADLLTLQSGGQTVFRVNESGNIYSGPQGGFFTSGADLAENYSSVETLLPGEVVQIDSANGDHNVKKTSGQYQKDVLGVVSTKPGFVAGAYTEDSHPIALVGRVPVKVSNENGPIRAGDYLTSSSIPGYAMKATVGGRVLGKALEDFKEEYATECPMINLGSLPTTKCGEVMLFANLVDYNGQSVDVAMAEQGFSMEDSELPNIWGLNFEANSEDRRHQEVLAFLRKQKDNNQGIFTDKIAATQEVISPKIITDLLVAKKIKAESIEGLEILTNKIELLSQSASSSAISQFSSQLNDNSLNVEELKESMKNLSARLEKMEAINLLAMSGLASGSGVVSTADNLLVFGTTTVNEASVMNSIVVGNTLTIGSSSINALQDLEIQPLKQGNVSFLGDSITFMANGEAIFRENATFEKSVAVRGAFTAHTVQSTQLLLVQGKTTILSETEVESTSAAGLITLRKNTDHIKVFNNLVKDTSLIFITPKTHSSNQLYLLEQEQEDPEEEIKGSFTVGIDGKAEKNIEFNYLIVN